MAEDKKPSESPKLDEKETHHIEESNQLHELTKTIEEITKQRDDLNVVKLLVCVIVFLLLCLYYI